MKVLVWGSIKIKELDIRKYLPNGCDQIIMGGIGGVDFRVTQYAMDNGIRLAIMLPANESIDVEKMIIKSDEAVIFTNEYISSVVAYCVRHGKPYEIIKREKK